MQALPMILWKLHDIALTNERERDITHNSDASLAHITLSNVTS